ncbi:MAG: arginine--tRNA ligase [Geodermatophilaceae bacterium]|nr:arginine--tRNA ligase [Geodermatophilaceae bacterium]
MTPEDLAAAIARAVDAAVDAGALSVGLSGDIVVERPKNRDHGDYATNTAMRLAKPNSCSPREIAELLATALRGLDGIAGVAVAGPGFLNIRLAPAAQGALIKVIAERGPSYGHTDTLSGQVTPTNASSSLRPAAQRINLEYVSANPVGPLHIGHARWAAVGDSLARLMVATGADVVREYYFNDAGAQIDRFAASLDAAARGEPAPLDGYQGDYIGDVAAQVVRATPGLFEQPRDKALEVFAHDGLELMFAAIRTSLADFGVTFDVFFNEGVLYASGAVETTVQRLREAGHVYEADGAVWLRTTDFGDDKDRVIVRSDGRPTYFCADLAYFVDKRERGADKVVILLGADHHGYIGRMRSLVMGLGENPDETLEIIIGQMVNIQGDKMSKRSGNLLTLEALVETIGVDAARYALVRSSMDSTIELDLDLWASQTSDNPVFYVQYAHARIASLLRNAEDLGYPIRDLDGVAVELLSHEKESELLASLGEFPRILAAAAQFRAPHRVARYLEDLAGTYHRFYDACRILPRADEDPAPAMVPRLWLCQATRTVLANGLGLLGVSAPERM